MILLTQALFTCKQQTVELIRSVHARFSRLDSQNHASNKRLITKTRKELTTKFDKILNAFLERACLL
jgi:hypothetical protein